MAGRGVCRCGGALWPQPSATLRRDLAAAQQSALIASELQDAQRYGATELVALNQYLETGDASMLPYVISYHGSTQRASANAQSYLEEQGNTFDLAKMNTAVVGKAAPEFELTDATGKSYKLADFKGKKAVVLVFVYGDT